jgi:hypothetical protein
MELGDLAWKLLSGIRLEDANLKGEHRFAWCERVYVREAIARK